jgi:hypothetical protein
MQRIGLKGTSLLVTLAGFVAPERRVSVHDVATVLAVTQPRIHSELYSFQQKWFRCMCFVGDTLQGGLLRGHYI